MARLLSRLGRFSARRAWLVIVAWLVALAAAGGAFLAFGGSLASTFSIPGTETERVNDLLADEIGGIDGATGTVVFDSADDAALDDDQRAAISDLLAALPDLDGVAGVVDPFETAEQRSAQAAQLAGGAEQLDAARAQLEMAAAAGMLPPEEVAASEARLDAEAAQLDAGQRLLAAAAEIRTVSDDGSTAIGLVQFEDDLFTLSPDVKAAVAAALDDADIAGVRVDYSSTIAASIDGLLGLGEVVGVALAGIVLLIMLRALLPALLPLVSSVIGVGVGVLGSLAFSSVVDMSSVTPVLGVMLGLAVGIDYSLFILNRHRRQVKDGMAVPDSIALANGTSGGAVVFAGSTVLIALLALAVTGIPFLAVMGVVAAACVAIAVLIAITLTPALLGLLGRRVLDRRSRMRTRAPAHLATDPRPMPTWRAAVTVAVAAGALLALAVPALSMRLGLPDGTSEAVDSTQYRAATAVEREFGAGQNGPLLVVASLADGVDEAELPLVQADLADRLLELDHVAAVAPAGASADRDVLAFQVVPTDGPSSVATEELVHALRGLSPLTLADGTAVDAPVELGVAGQATGNIDVSERLADALPVYLAVVVGLSLVILVLVFRSILVPLLATGGFVLSLFAAFGGMTAVYQFGFAGELFDVHHPAPLLSFAPIIVMGVLFGLAMDYQLFLVTGMREAYVHGTPARAAVTAGLRSGRAVVTAAAIIMISVFGGFVFSHLGMVRPLGFGLAFGVLLDAFVVRMLLVPAVMHLLGPAAWWIPRWLDRILPNVDVEGASLERELAAADGADDAPSSDRREPATVG